jgi:3-oxoacyl-[acyl-carrier-protein] synthase III
MIYSSIRGTGSYVPETIITNEDLAKTVDTDHAWIVERTGIHSRSIAAPHETSASMAFEASLRAIAAAGILPTEIDLIIVATTTPDKVLPSTSCILQSKLGLSGVPAFDLGAACAGFIYALSVADQFIKAGQYKTVLVVGAELMSSIVDWTDRSTCILFGDGAGAVILQASDKAGILSSHLHADGAYGDMLSVPTGLTNRADPASPTYVHMRGQEVFKFAVKALGDIVDETLAANQLDKSSIDWLIPHQANLRIIQATAKKLSMPMEKVILTIHKHANTSAASIPLALDEGVRDGRIQRGDTLLMEGIGGGFAWGSALVIY